MVADRIVRISAEQIVILPLAKDCIVRLLPLLMILSSPADLAAALPAAPQSTMFMPSLIEPLATPPAEPAGPELRIADQTATGPSLVETETPEIESLASWQASYLWLLGDDGKALSGFYDPFSFQFAYGQNGHQPYRLGW